MDDNDRTWTGPQSFSQIDYKQQEKSKSNPSGFRAVEKMLMSLSQTFRFDGDPKLAANAYHLVLDALPEWRIAQAGRLALVRHKYKSMPMPASFLEWALEDEGRMDTQASAGGRTGIWVFSHKDEKGYEFYKRRGT